MANKTLVVIGGGAAGFFCAVNAAAKDSSLRVIILEKTGKLLSKVRVSGGGRCNVTHNCDDITVMSNRYPRGKNFVKRSFHGFFTTDTVEWFRKRGVELKTEPDGRMFPVTNSSETIIRCLLNEASTYGVEIMMNTTVSSVELQHAGFLISADRGGRMENIQSDFVCVATGGYPKEEQYNWMKVFGHRLVKPVPSLFTFNSPRHPITELMGISVPVAELRIPEFKFKEQGPLLITHWGLSGPLVLRASAWCARELQEKQYEASLVINWNADYKEPLLRDIIHRYRNEQGAQKVRVKPAVQMPQRLWEFLAAQSGVKDQNWSDLPATTQNKLIRHISAYELHIKGKTTFKEEFVTAGGIHLSEIDPATMQSRIIPGLYFAGEVMDVDGITGGYNFQHAWTSGYNAAMDIAGKSLN